MENLADALKQAKLKMEAKKAAAAAANGGASPSVAPGEIRPAAPPATTAPMSLADQIKAKAQARLNNAQTTPQSAPTSAPNVSSSTPAPAAAAPKIPTPPSGLSLADQIKTARLNPTPASVPVASKPTTPTSGLSLADQIKAARLNPTPAPAPAVRKSTVASSGLSLADQIKAARLNPTPAPAPVAPKPTAPTSGLSLADQIKAARLNPTPTTVPVAPKPTAPTSGLSLADQIKAARLNPTPNPAARVTSAMPGPPSGGVTLGEQLKAARLAREQGLPPPVFPTNVPASVALSDPYAKPKLNSYTQPAPVAKTSFALPPHLQTPAQTPSTQSTLRPAVAAQVQSSASVPSVYEPPTITPVPVPGTKESAAALPKPSAPKISLAEQVRLNKLAKQQATDYGSQASGTQIPPTKGKAPSPPTPAVASEIDDRKWKPPVDSVRLPPLPVNFKPPALNLLPEVAQIPETKKPEPTPAPAPKPAVKTWSTSYIPQAQKSYVPIPTNTGPAKKWPTVGAKPAPSPVPPPITAIQPSSQVKQNSQNSSQPLNLSSSQTGVAISRLNQSLSNASASPGLTEDEIRSKFSKYADMAQSGMPDGSIRLRMLMEVPPVPTSQINAFLRGDYNGVIGASNSSSAKEEKIVPVAGRSISFMRTLVVPSPTETSPPITKAAASALAPAPAPASAPILTSKTTPTPTPAAAPVNVAPPAPTTSTTTVSFQGDAKFEVYAKMQKLNLPEGAIRQKMMKDGLSAAEQEMFFNAATGSPASPSPAAPVTPPAAATVTPPAAAPSSQSPPSDSKFTVYFKMQKLNLPEGAIRQKMMKDGFSSADQEAFFSGSYLTSENSTPPAPTPDPKPVTLAAIAPTATIVAAEHAHLASLNPVTSVTPAPAPASSVNPITIVIPASTPAPSQPMSFLDQIKAGKQLKSANTPSPAPQLEPGQAPRISLAEQIRLNKLAKEQIAATTAIESIQPSNGSNNPTNGSTPPTSVSTHTTNESTYFPTAAAPSLTPVSTLPSASTLRSKPASAVTAPASPPPNYEAENKHSSYYENVNPNTTSTSPQLQAPAQPMSFLDQIKEGKRLKAAAQAAAEAVITSPTQTKAPSITLDINSTYVTSSGLRIKVLRSATRDESRSAVAATHECTVMFEGRLPNGTIFSEGEMSAPLDALVQGWSEALQLMAEGDRWILTVPPELAYGAKGLPPHVPPNTTLTFEVELKKVIGPSKPIGAARQRLQEACSGAHGGAVSPPSSPSNPSNGPSTGRRDTPTLHAQQRLRHSRPLGLAPDGGLDKVHFLRNSRANHDNLPGDPAHTPKLTHTPTPASKSVSRTALLPSTTQQQNLIETTSPTTDGDEKTEITTVNQVWTGPSHAVVMRTTFSVVELRDPDPSDSYGPASLVVEEKSLRSRLKAALPKPRSASERVKAPLEFTSENEAFFASLVERHIAEKRRQEEEEAHLDPLVRQRMKMERDAAKRHDTLKTEHYLRLGGVFARNNRLSVKLLQAQQRIDLAHPPGGSTGRGLFPVTQNDSTVMADIASASIHAFMRTSKTVLELFGANSDSGRESSRLTIQ